MFILYDLIFLVIALVYLPVYLFKRKFHRGFMMRLGRLPKDSKFHQPVWFHAVSVGEAISIRGLVRELRAALDNKQFVFSTVTATGNKIAAGLKEEGDFVTYLPLDFGFIAKKAIDRIKPSLFIIAETELWPNLISYLYSRRIPIIVVNGRISDRSWRGYLLLRFLARKILNKITLFCVQSIPDAERLVRLGVRGDKIRITGNLKFDVEKDYQDLKIDYTDHRLKLRLKSQEKLLTAGSTHPGEEEIVLDAYQALLKDFPNLRLLLAPRHPERAAEVSDLVKKCGFAVQRTSFLDETTGQQLNETAVFILDTIGQLTAFYAISDIVFVGGSLTRAGGHNILEPAAAGKPVLFGPCMFNFRDIAELFLDAKAARLVRNAQDLKTAVRYLLDNPAAAALMIRRGRELIIKNQGATSKNTELIKKILSDNPESS